MRIPNETAPGTQRGVGLIEVMIAIVVLAIGVLGIAALQALTLKNSVGSSVRSQASVQVYSMMDIIRADRDKLGDYNTNIFVDGDGSGQPGTLMGWLDSLKITVAPDAKGRVVCIADTMTCTVGVQWSDANTTGAARSTLDVSIMSQL